MKSRSVMWFGVTPSAVGGCAVALAALGCGAQSQNGGGSDTSTDWVRTCQLDEECNPDELCGCGLCTRECNSDADCAAFSPSARCVPTPDACGREQTICAPDEAFSWGPGSEDAPRIPSIRPEQFEGAKVPSELRLARDASGAAWRVIEVPAAANEPALVRTPIGWLALSRRSLGDGKALTPVQSVLYRSWNGVNWESLPLEPGHDDLWLQSLAYGAGRYVMIGRRLPGGGVIWSSNDGVSWTEIEQGFDQSITWGSVVFAADRFFALGSRHLGVSEDGQSWISVPIELVQPQGVTYGNGRYLLTGGGPVHVSEDGYSWRAHELDCALPGACLTDPSGNVSQANYGSSLFVEGRFFTGQVSSVDGVNWEPHSGRSPSAYADGYFLSGLSDAGLQIWTSSTEPETLHVVRPAKEAVTAASRRTTSIGVLDREGPLPERVDVPFEDELTCETAACVVVGSRLLLVPPLGTPPLPDRVPRDAEGAPLLTDDCPNSSMIFCEDYATRSGCVCLPDAPSAPHACDDVSHYQCAGRFTPLDDEWQLEEIAQAGCDCDAIDPNQPATLGTSCVLDGDECAAPLQCLEIDYPYTIGPPFRPLVCTASCTVDADCPSWEASGYCAGPVQLRCSENSCQPRDCE